jgi:D-hydroxyproline dehydrogenase subunit gamma
MFSPIMPFETSYTIYLDGQPIPALADETIAACLLRARVSHFQTTPVGNSPRLAYCMIGNCFDCLIEIVGVGSRQACLFTVEDGMQLKKLNASINVSPDTQS